MRSKGLLIVTRFNVAVKYEWTDKTTKMPVLELSHDEVAARHRGFDWEPWGGRDWESEYGFLTETGLGDLDQYQQIREVLSRDFGRDSDLIYIGGLSTPAGLPDGFSFAGYDYGYYESVWNCYSVVLNEVIYGLIPIMRGFGNSLNANLLIPTVAETERLGAVRQRLLESGTRGLEDDSDEWYAIGIWLYRNANGT